MLRNSSIFSFDTLTALPRPGPAIAFTLALCAVFRLSLFMASGWLDTVPTPAVNQRTAYLEKTLVRDAKETPNILLMGSSLARYGLLEHQIAAAADLPPDQVVNLGIENGSPFNALVMLRRNPRLQANARLIVYQIEPGQLNFGARVRWIDYFYRDSTLEEKLSADRYRDRAKLLVDWAWPYHSQRRDLVTWLLGLRGETDFWHFGSLRPAWTKENFTKMMAKSHNFASTPPAGASFGIGPVVSEQYLKQLKDFIALCKERNINLLLITSPFRKVLIEAIESDARMRAGLCQFEEIIASLGTERAEFHTGRQHEQLDLDDATDFMDYAHMTPGGARKLTAGVIEALKRHGKLPLSDPHPQGIPYRLVRTAGPTGS